jgi:hypothetical protein
MKLGRRHAFGLGPHIGPHRVRNRRNVRQAAQQGLEIHARPPGEDGQPPLLPQFRQNGARILDVAADGVIHRPVDMAEQPVRHAGFLLGRRSGRDDAEIAVDLHRIGIDHDAAELPRQPDGQRGLAARRRACDEKGLDPINHTALRAFEETLKT